MLVKGARLQGLVILAAGTFGKELHSHFIVAEGKFVMASGGSPMRVLLSVPPGARGYSIVEALVTASGTFGS